MKTNKKLKKYFKSRVKGIETELQKPDKNFNKEDFHNLRVEIKKTRALAAMVNSATKKFNRKKTLKPLKKIFQQAGKVRELQLEEALLRKYDSKHQLRNYLQYLGDREHNEKEAFANIHKANKIHLKKTGKKITSFINKVNKKDVNKYVKGKENEIKKLVKKDRLKISQVHQLRKDLKQLQYDLKSLSNKKIKENGMDALQELMGRWHDLRVMHRQLKNAINRDLVRPSERKPALQIADKLKEQSQILFEKINKEKAKGLSHV